MDSVLENSLTSKRKFGDDSYMDGPESKTMCVSPWEYRKMKAELIQYQTQVIRLEDRIDAIQKNHKEAVILFDKEKAELKHELHTKKKENAEIIYKLKKLKRKEADLQHKVSDDVKELQLLKRFQSEKLIQLDDLNNELQDQLIETGDNSELFKNQWVELCQTKNKLTKTVVSLEEYKERCCNLEAQLAVALQDVKDTEELQNSMASAQTKIRELEGNEMEFEIARKTTCTLRDRVLQLNKIDTELEAKKQEVVQLRMAVSNKVMLEEQVHNLQAKLQAVAQFEVLLMELKEKEEAMGKELQEWRSIATDFASSVNTASLRNYMEALHRKELTNSLEISNLTASIRTLDATVCTLRNELTTLKSCNGSIKTNLNTLRLENQLIRKKAILLTKERDCYREQLDTFEKDLTLIGVKESSEMTSAEPPQRDVVAQHREQVKRLEDMLDEYRNLVGQLQSVRTDTQHEEDAEEIVKLKNQITRLEEYNNALTQRKDALEVQLEERIAGGDYPYETKVLHFTRNPAAEARKKLVEEIKELEKECEKLKARVKLLEEGEQLDITRKVAESVETSANERVKGKQLDITRKVAESVETSANERVKELEEQLNSSKLKMQRLKEFFSTMGQNFRDVSYMLLGYRIDLVNKNNYRLTSMYSDTPEDFFMFQQCQKEGDAKLEMLETPFAQTLSDLVYQHLHKGNSIPAFLSAVTLALHATTAVPEQEEEEEEDGDDEDDNDNEEEGNDDEESEEADDNEEENAEPQEEGEDHNEDEVDDFGYVDDDDVEEEDEEQEGNDDDESPEEIELN